MGKITGFLEYKRELPKDRDPKERVHDWHEFHLPFEDERLRIQGARCMDCGIPFCHSGILINGMACGCPLNNLIPDWNDLVYHGFWQDALDRLLVTNNFPEFTGRVCPAPCEGSCVLGINEPPVTIKNIEYSIIERGFENDWCIPEPPLNRTGKKVAVVGSGPSGLACAQQLNRAGHWVSIFERNDRAGGLLMYGIPNMKLDKGVVKRRVDLLEQEGIRFFTNVEVGTDYSVDRLLKDFDAVVLCGGSTRPRDLSVEGRNLQGIHLAMDFLQANTRRVIGNDTTNFISAKDKDVIVIGGGDTGTDCIATAIRHGCKSILQFEILPMPPSKRAIDNPWPQWQKIYRTDYGQEEALSAFGCDPRRFSIMTKRFSGDMNGHVKEAHTVDVEWKKGENGRYTPVEIPATERIWPAQLVILAMGFLGPEETLIEKIGVERDRYSNVKAEYGKFNTNIEGVFTAGDMRRGPSLVVWAIMEGRGAARECDRYLMGSTMLP